MVAGCSCRTRLASASSKRGRTIEVIIRSIFSHVGGGIFRVVARFKVTTRFLCGLAGARFTRQSSIGPRSGTLILLLVIYHNFGACSSRSAGGRDIVVIIVVVGGTSVVRIFDLFNVLHSFISILGFVQITDVLFQFIKVIIVKTSILETALLCGFVNSLGRQLDALGRARASAGNRFWATARGAPGYNSMAARDRQFDKIFLISRSGPGSTARNVIEGGAGNLELDDTAGGPGWFSILRFIGAFHLVDITNLGFFLAALGIVLGVGGYFAGLATGGVDGGVLVVILILEK